MNRKLCLHHFRLIKQIRVFVDGKDNSPALDYSILSCGIDNAKSKACALLSIKNRDLYIYISQSPLINDSVKYDDILNYLKE
jgi:hypothetical protein